MYLAFGTKEPHRLHGCAVQDHGERGDAKQGVLTKDLWIAPTLGGRGVDYRLPPVDPTGQIAQKNFSV